jgi:hypothetical protein
MNHHEHALQVLLGHPLRRIGRAADLLWLQFGDWREVSSHRGGTRLVGEWALHIQTPWSFVRDSRIIVGTRDLYYYAESSPEFGESGREFDWDKDGESRFDRHTAALNQEFDLLPPIVSRISCDSVGAFTLSLGDSLNFSVFPNCASSSPDFEFWRLFQPATDQPHYVVATDATPTANETDAENLLEASVSLSESSAAGV